MNKTVLRNARVVNRGAITEADICMEGARIAVIGAAPKSFDRAKSYDLGGRYALPGAIDDQVHFREPGLTHKADIATESRAAVAGGVTSFMEMPNTAPTTTNHARLAEKYARAAQVSAANYAFYLGATTDNLEEIKRLKPSQAAGVKIFMGASTGNMLVDNPAVLADIFANAPALIATHCEDSAYIAESAKRIAKHYKEYPPHAHMLIRDHEACIRSTRLALELARKYDAPLHVLHISTAAECELFEQGDIANKRITAEACVHHLNLDSNDYAALGNQIKCNPAIKTAEDRAAIREALALDKIDVIATDHAPHTWQEKQLPYPDAPAGLPLIQHFMPLALELVADKVLTLPDIAKKCAHNVAERFKVQGRGYLDEGTFADICVVDVARGHIVRNEDMFAKCAWSPFAGQTLRASVYATFVNGALAYHQDTLGSVGTLHPSQGMALQFGAQR